VSTRGQGHGPEGVAGAARQTGLESHRAAFPPSALHPAPAARGPAHPGSAGAHKQRAAVSGSAQVRQRRRGGSHLASLLLLPVLIMLLAAGFRELQTVRGVCLLLAPGSCWPPTGPRPPALFLNDPPPPLPPVYYYVRRTLRIVLVALARALTQPRPPAPLPRRLKRSGRTALPG